MLGKAELCRSTSPQLPTCRAGGAATREAQPRVPAAHGAWRRLPGALPRRPGHAPPSLEPRVVDGTTPHPTATPLFSPTLPSAPPGGRPATRTAPRAGRYRDRGPGRRRPAGRRERAARRGGGGGGPCHCRREASGGRAPPPLIDSGARPAAHKGGGAGRGAAEGCATAVGRRDPLRNAGSAPGAGRALSSRRLSLCQVRRKAPWLSAG